ncbi:TRAP transporter small permease [Pikeienuella piscinae]|uniref:TRAP transporter small permease protein n=1 Tax=Pikeienuella piscinae TaxID=2748098 RepID=A0A7L5C3C5_9RHOB|nr:TRAP transporter small permease [Pikeienuella piscinae]QIE57016.1 TRAP transporter small permease [Pikeienuella piscinae]
MRAFLEGYYRLLKLLLTALMVALVIPVSMQILSRYTGLIPRYIWTEEIARFCFVWIILIGAMIAVRDDTHFDVDVLPHSRDPRVEFGLRMFARLAILLMAFSFLWWGWDFGVLGSRQRSEISGLPMLSIYIAWPLAGATWVLFTVEKIADEMAAMRRGDVHGAR